MTIMTTAAKADFHQGDEAVIRLFVGRQIIARRRCVFRPRRDRPFRLSKPRTGAGRLSVIAAAEQRDAALARAILRRCHSRRCHKAARRNADARFRAAPARLAGAWSNPYCHTDSKIDHGRAMLRKEQNELLTQTGPGTPMGQLFRSYWLPVLLAEELPRTTARRCGSKSCRSGCSRFAIPPANTA